MADLPKFMLKPFRDGYNFVLGRSTLTTQYTAGLPRQRRVQVGAVHRLQATYKCRRSQYQYLMAFLRVYEAKPFLAYLLLDDINHQWYECRIVSDDISVSTLGDQIFTVSLDLAVKSKPHNLDADESLIAIYEMTDGQIDAFFNHLEKQVNEDLPDALGSLNS